MKNEITAAANSDGVNANDIGNALVRAAMGSIPVVGNFLVEALNLTGKRREENFKEFVAELSRSLAHVSNEKLDKEYLKSPDFAERIAAITSIAIRTRHTAKRKLLAEAAKSRILDKTSADIEETYIDILDTISAQEFAVLQAFAGPLPSMLEARDTLRASGAHKIRDEVRMERVDYESGVCGVSGNPLRILLQSLTQKGLLFDDTAGRIGAEPWTIMEATELALGFLRWTIYADETTRT